MTDVIPAIREQVCRYRYFSIVLILTLLYAVFFSWVGIWWHGLYYTNVDLDIFEQALWTTIHSGEILYTNEYGGSSHFGTHFSPILLLMLPVYALAPVTETIIIIQAVILAMGAIPLYYIGKKEVSEPAGVITSVVYLLYPALHGVNTCEFHEIVFFPFLYLAAAAFLIHHRYTGYLVCGLLCLTIKEDIALPVIMLALWGAWRDRQSLTSRGRFHLALFLAAVITAAAAIMLIIPFFNPEGIYPHFSNVYFAGDTLAGDTANSRMTFLIQLFAPLLGIPVLAPEILVIGTPGFLELFIPEYPAFRDIGQHYSAILIPVIMMALVFGLARLERIASSRDRRIFPAICILLLLSSGISTILISPSPLSIGFQHVWAYDQKIQPYKAVLDPLIREIDQNKEISVATHHPLLTHLARRMYLFTGYDDQADIILVADGYPDGRALHERIHATRFIPIFHRYDITLYLNKEGKLNNSSRGRPVIHTGNTLQAQ